MSTAIATTTEETPFSKRLRNALESSKDKMLAVLPRHLTPERMIQLTTTAVYRTPKLQECDPMSIVASVVEASEVGLEIGGTRGEGYLIPRWNSKAKKLECQFQPSYRGLVKLATNSAEIKSIHAYTFFENDVFDYELGIDVKIVHKPALGERGKLVGVYCAGRLASGEAFAEVMDKDTVERIRGYSQSPNAGPWENEWEEMARKTVTKRKLKMLPCSSEKLHRAIELDNREYPFDDTEPSVALAQKTQLKAADLRQRLTAPRNGETVDGEVIDAPKDSQSEPGTQETTPQPFDEAGLRQELRDKVSKLMKGRKDKSDLLASRGLGAIAEANIDQLQQLVDELEAV